MFPEKFLDFGCSMIGRPIDKKNDFPYLVPLSVVYEVRKMPPELDVSPSIETIPHNFLFWPKKGDKAVDSFRISWCRNFYYSSFWRPSSLGFSEKFSPLFILKCDEDLFFKSMLAARL